MSRGSKKRSYFYGWYLKHQNDSATIAFIPAFHINDLGERSASLQVITDEIATNFDFFANEFHSDKKRFLVRIGDSNFSENSCTIKVSDNKFDISGTLRYVRFTKLNYDIMGPFALIPFLECRHSVLSMYHQVWGEITINGRKTVFENGKGYVEGDSGRSFPDRYIWTQCSFENNSIMAAVADVPLGKKSITGIVAAILYKHKQYRLSTYLGAKIESLTAKSILIRQGKLSLYIERYESKGKNLLAPHLGSMTRTIHECPSCTVRYCFAINNEIVFDIISEMASYEHNWTK